MPDAARAIRAIFLAGKLWTRVLTFPPALALCLALCLVLGLVLGPGSAQPAFAEISGTPSSTRQATRGVNTPVIRPDEYNAKMNESRAKMNESRAKEQTLKRNLPRNGHATPRFQHPGKNVRPQTSADRSPLTRR